MARPHPSDPSVVLRALSLLRRVSAAAHDWQSRQVRTGFTANQALVLHHLVKHGPASPSALADWMHVTRGSVTPTVQRLEELGLATRRTDETDGRRCTLHATPKARAMASSIEAQVLRPTLMAFAAWPTAELQALCAGLERVLSTGVFGGKP